MLKKNKDKEIIEKEGSIAETVNVISYSRLDFHDIINEHSFLKVNLELFVLSYITTNLFFEFKYKIDYFECFLFKIRITLNLTPNIDDSTPIVLKRDFNFWYSPTYYYERNSLTDWVSYSYDPVIKDMNSFILGSGITSIAESISGFDSVIYSGYMEIEVLNCDRHGLPK